MFKKFIATSITGRALFYLYIYDFMGVRIYDTNLPDLYLYGNLKISLDKIQNPCATEAEVEELGNELLIRIKKVVPLKKFYLPAHFDEANYNPLTEEGLERLLQSVKSRVPYTQISHPKTLQGIIRDRVVFGLKHGARLRRINKKTFEEKLLNRSLIDCYLDSYSQKLVYYHFSSDSERILFTVIDNQITMLFFTWTAEEEWRKHLNVQ